VGGAVADIAGAHCRLDFNACGWLVLNPGEGGADGGSSGSSGDSDRSTVAVGSYSS
jgi:hypothetical protein